MSCFLNRIKILFSFGKVSGFFILAGLLFFTSCDWVRMRTRNDAVARVYNQYLYRSDLLGIVPQGTSAADSALIIQKYIDNWVRQKILVREANRQLTLKKNEYEKQLQDYRNSLVIYAWENQQVVNQLDTVITIQEISDFYEQNLEIFQLKESIVRISYVKVPLQINDPQNISRLIRMDDANSHAELEEYCLQHAASFLLDSEAWMVFNDLLREIPVQTGNPESFLRSNDMVELTDEFYRYFLRIHDYKLKGSTSPLGFEHDNIRNILVNKRKMQFLTQLRQKVVQEAIDNKNIETFY